MTTDRTYEICDTATGKYWNDRLQKWTDSGTIYNSLRDADAVATRLNEEDGFWGFADVIEH